MLELQSLTFPADLPTLFAQMDKGAMPLAGGTDILPLYRDGKICPDTLADLSALRGSLGGIRQEGNALVIGATTRLCDVAANDTVARCFPALAMAAGMVGSAQIRNRATLAGNIVHASPAADTLPALVAAGASLVLQSAEASREVPIEAFILGPGKTLLDESEVSEIVAAVKIPLPTRGWRGAYQKLGGRTALTISIAAVALLHSDETGWRAAYGAVGPVIRRATLVEQALNAGDPGALAGAVQASISPIDDVRASAGYRRQVCLNMTSALYGTLCREVK